MLRPPSLHSSPSLIKNIVSFLFPSLAPIFWRAAAMGDMSRFLNVILIGFRANFCAMHVKAFEAASFEIGAPR